MNSLPSLPTRRDLAALLLAAGRSYRPTLTGQAYVWTQHLARQKRTLADGLDEVIAGFAEAGFRQVELMAEFYSSALRERTAALLAKHGLKVPVVYRGGPMHLAPDAEKTVAAVLETAAAVQPLGAVAINFNASPKPNKAAKTAEELATQLRYVNRLGAELHRRGLRFFIHQHDPEMADNAREWRHLLRGTDPNTTSFCLDLHWVFRGGQDPMALLKEAAGRAGSLHLRNSRGRVWLEEFADGDIDYRQVAAYLKRTRYQGYLTVELAYEAGTRITRPLADSLRRSRLYAEQVFDVKA